MKFIVPTFSILKTNTLNLENIFSTYLGRYKIVDNTPPPSIPPSGAAVKQNSLDLLIARTNQVTECVTKRIAQRDVFKQLVNELRDVAAGNDESRKKQAAMILLGALIHRYFRLIEEYRPYSLNVGVGFSFFKVKVAKVTDCNLFLAIRTALQFKPDPQANFEEVDLNTLDVTTIVQSLEAFKNHMLVEDKNKKVKYKTYAHFEADPNFIKYLNKIIKKYTELGAPVLKQFNAIRFIRSLVLQLDNEINQFEVELLRWSDVFKKSHPDFLKLSTELIIDHVDKHNAPQAFKKRMIYLMSTKHMQEKFNSMDHQSFVQALLTLQSDLASHIAYGGYCLLFRTEAVNEQLKFRLSQALAINDMKKDLDDTDLYNGIYILKKWVEESPDTFLDSVLFGGREQLNTQILREEKALYDLITEPEEEQAPNPT